MNIWIVGAGAIAGCYHAIASHLGHRATVIGRGEESAERFGREHGVPVVAGGVEAALGAGAPPPDLAIVAVSGDQLAHVACALVEHGVRRVLVEKPAGRTHQEVARIDDAARRKGAAVFVAYNRRFLGSVAKAREVIASDGGVTSFTFEFTEWPHRVLAFAHPPGVLEAWFYMNSTHVVDLAFHLGGTPRRLDAVQGRPLPWHRFGTFAGAGETEMGAPFAYHADWHSSGRWRIELCTPARRLILAPLEKLAQVPLRSVEVAPVAFDEAPDLSFKPGFLRQVEAFLAPVPDPCLLTIAAHRAMWGWYARMCPEGHT